MANIVSLNLAGMKHLSDGDVAGMVGSCRQLRSLNLTRVFGVGDQTCQVLRFVLRPRHD